MWRWHWVGTIGAVSTPPELPIDHSPDEIESHEELVAHLATGSLAGLTVQGLKIDLDQDALRTIDLTDTVFVGCQFTDREVEAELVRRGAHVVPGFPELPFPTQPTHLYTPDELAAGFESSGFESMYDTQVYRHFLARGGALPDVREALAQRLHDHGIDDALQDALAAWAAVSGGPVVGVMGGHAELRGTTNYRLAAQLGRRLARSGCLLVTGGGPGVMEAANLGAYLADHPDDALTDAIDRLATAPDFHEHEAYTRTALQVRKAFPVTGPVANPVEHPTGEIAVAWARHGGLSVPTWLYGHEPANLFAARIAKYFSNAIREDTILRLVRGGIVFAPGRAGTVQEIFQAATKTFYATDGASGPFIFLGSAYWRQTLPVETLLRPLLAASPHGDMSHLVHVTDDVDEAVELLLSHNAAQL